MKLVDFGFASRVEDLKLDEVSMGTPVYVAPEIIRGSPYGTGLPLPTSLSHALVIEVDMWSFGVICYIILCGCPPFLHENLAELLDKILEGQATFTEEHWKEVSIEAIDFCRKMLCVDQCDRSVTGSAPPHPPPSGSWTARQMLNHKWMTQADEKCGRRHLSNSISQLKVNSIRLKRLGRETEVMGRRRKSISTESPSKQNQQSSWQQHHRLPPLGKNGEIENTRTRAVSMLV
jgi:serine/threonine protein kinase